LKANPEVGSPAEKDPPDPGAYGKRVIRRTVDRKTNGALGRFLRGIGLG
jgi:hypothetical protein